MGALEIAKRLYRVDRDRYKSSFEFVNSSIKRYRRSDLTLECMRRLEERERQSPVADVRSYLAGTLRRLIDAEEAATLRSTRGGDDFIREFTGKIIEAIDAANKHSQPERRSRHIRRRPDVGRRRSPDRR
jgi:hypothetical protein